MKREFILLIILLLSITFSCSRKIRIKPPEIVNGTIDFTEWDFAKNDPVKLKGNSYFFWNKLIPPKNIQEHLDANNPKFMKIPGTWEKFKNPDDFNKKNYTVEGCATYIIKIKGLNKKNQGDLAILFDHVFTSHKVYFVNSLLKKDYKPILMNGIVSCDKSQAISTYTDGIARLTSLDDLNYLIIHVSNFSYKKGGIINIPQIGTEKQIKKDFEFLNYISFIIIGIILMMGVYHIVLFSQRPEDKSNIMFSLFCFVVVFRKLIMDRVIENSFSAPDPNFFELMRMSEYFTIFMLLPLFYSFMKYIFPNEFSKIIERTTWFCCFVLFIITIIYPYSKYCRIVVVYQLLLFMVGSISIIQLIKSIIRKRHGSIISMIGFVLFFLTAINDIFAANILFSSIYLLSYGLVIFIFCQSFIIAKLFGTTYRDAQRMNKELKELNTSLEERVDERTAELSATMEELEAMNEALVETKDQLWSEIEIAKKIQTVLVPNAPKVLGYEIAVYFEPADQVGGDYYDVIQNGGYDWFIIGDVSGHGVPAGLIMMMTQTAIQTALVVNSNLKPSELLDLINTSLTKNIKLIDDGKYMTITVFAAHKDGNFTFAGLHQDILIYRNEKRCVESIHTNGIWIGMVNNIKDIFKDEHFNINKGDVILMFTDGITEAWIKGSEKNKRDPEYDMYGIKKLKKILEENGGQEPKKLIDILVNSLSSYDTDDDITLFALKKK